MGRQRVVTAWRFAARSRMRSWDDGARVVLAVDFDSSESGGRRGQVSLPPAVGPRRNLPAGRCSSGWPTRGVAGPGPGGSRVRRSVVPGGSTANRALRERRARNRGRPLRSPCAPGPVAAGLPRHARECRARGVDRSSTGPVGRDGGGASAGAYESDSTPLWVSAGRGGALPAGRSGRGASVGGGQGTDPPAADDDHRAGRDLRIRGGPVTVSCAPAPPGLRREWLPWLSVPEARVETGRRADRRLVSGSGSRFHLRVAWRRSSGGRHPQRGDTTSLRFRQRERPTSRRTPFDRRREP